MTKVLSQLRLLGTFTIAALNKLQRGLSASALQGLTKYSVTIQAAYGGGKNPTPAAVPPAASVSQANSKVKPAAKAA